VTEAAAAAVTVMIFLIVIPRVRTIVAGNVPLGGQMPDLSSLVEIAEPSNRSGMGRALLKLREEPAAEASAL
jgi:hypothetical protein